jgi:hypothetical protein
MRKGITLLALLDILLGKLQVLGQVRKEPAANGLGPIAYTCRRERCDGSHDEKK